jgi:hypothetical protein
LLPSTEVAALVAAAAVAVTAAAAVVMAAAVVIGRPEVLTLSTVPPASAFGSTL